jgi:uncharacterized protein YegL
MFNNENNNNSFDDFDFDAFGYDETLDSSSKLPVCLVLDCSKSMIVSNGFQGSPRIDDLNKNVKNLIHFIKSHKKASMMTDLAIISFGGYKAHVISDYTNVHEIQFHDLIPEGKTPMGDALNQAIDLLMERRKYYKDYGIKHYKPILMLMSDGGATDRKEFYEAAARCSELVNSGQLKVFPVGIGADFNDVELRKVSPILKPKQVQDTKDFAKLFELLSKSTNDPNNDEIDEWFAEEL